MKIALDAIRQLRVQGQQMLKVAEALEHLNAFADGYHPKVKRSRDTRLKMALAQKKRWAKARRK